MKGDGHDGPSVGPDIQWTPFRRHGPAEVDPDFAPDSIFQAVDKSGFEAVWPVSQPGPTVIPVPRLVEAQSGIGRTSGPRKGAGATPIALFPGEHAMAGSTPPGKEDRLQRAAGFPGPMEGEVAGHVAGKMVEPDAPPTVFMWTSRFSLFP